MSRPTTPASAIPAPNLSRSNSQHAGYTGSRPMSSVGFINTGRDGIHQSMGAFHEPSALSQSEDLHDDSVLQDAKPNLQRSDSQMSQSQTMIASRGGTLKKKASLKRGGSLKRSNSRKSSYAGSVRSLKLGEKEKYEPSEEHNSAFYCPIPTVGNPTDLLADRFQAWRRVLKDLINYFRDLQKSYEARSKTLHSASNVINNISIPNNFLTTGGLADATYVLRDYYKLALTETSKSKELENEVIMQLTGLRSDLQQKIKEIKSLSGDFKNSVGKEQDGTRRAVRALQEALGSVDHDAASTSGKGDPFLVKLSVDRQIEKQIEEENYLHRAYLNLEASGRELESIVVGEIQKAYNVLTGIMKREADQSYEAVEKLKEGPLTMRKDHEWDEFVTNNTHMVDPRIPLRQLEQITYEGKDHPAAIEVKSGMLERKSKYLKNYTPGWYVLSPTHLHEFKSADHITYQAPIMSLYLPEQKLGTHSEPGSSSHKFMLKGRQTGSLHRGHSWIFRAETHDTMLAWFNDIKELTEKRGEARNEFVRRTHARTLSSGSQKAPSIRSAESGMEEDEADKVAFSGEQSIRGQSVGGVLPVAGTFDNDDTRSEPGWRPQRPNPGGRFPSDINVQRGLQMPLSPSSGDSFDEHDREAIAAAGALPGSDIPFVGGLSTQPHTDLQRVQNPAQPSNVNPDSVPTTVVGNAANPNPQSGIPNYTVGDHPRVVPTAAGAAPLETRSNYGDWMAPMAAASGAIYGVAATHAYDNHKQHHQQQQAEKITEQMDSSNSAIPAMGESSAPIAVATAAPTKTPVQPRAMDTPSNMMNTGAFGHNAATIAASNAIVGVAAPAPKQVLLSAGVDPNQAHAVNSTIVPGTERSTSPVTTLTSSTAEPSSVVSGVNASESGRPSARSAWSVQTISDLHVPGEFPQTPAFDQANFAGS